MSMILRDIRFPVREATLYGHVADRKGIPPGLSWSVEVQTEEQILKIPAVEESIDDEIFAAPRMSCEFEGFLMRRWLELEGKTVHSDTAAALPFPAAFSYFEEHERIPDSTLKFVKRSGNKFQIYWAGTCHPRLGEPYETDVPFLIQTEATFKEMSVHVNRKDTDATTLERLSQYLDPADFIQYPMKETVHQIPVENRFGIIDPLLRLVFRGPKTKPYVSRRSLFEPRV